MRWMYKKIGTISSKVIQQILSWAHYTGLSQSGISYNEYICLHQKLVVTAMVKISVSFASNWLQVVRNTYIIDINQNMQ